MARLPRIIVPGQPLHIMHRGNNRQDIFECEEDMSRIKGDIAVSLEKSACSLHAYVIMTNHLHFLITPESREDLSRFMQSVANRYVRYFNARHQRTGTIWEGRFKSCLVDSEQYLLTLYRYIEMNPVRAGMVESLVDYPWSSYHHNALGKKDALVTEHSVYRSLARNKAQSCQRYRELFDNPVNTQEDARIAEATSKGDVYGSEAFHKKIARQINRVTRLGCHGGDRKSKAYRDQAG